MLRSPDKVRLAWALTRQLFRLRGPFTADAVLCVGVIPHANQDWAGVNDLYVKPSAVLNNR